MLEWDDVNRHWWRYDKERVAMVHRASGEAIIYRGALSESGWHRFDYEHDDGAYPLVVQMKRVNYPNPLPDRWNMPPWNDGGTPVLRPWIWRIDHDRSRNLWRSETKTVEKHPPYWLWHRTDIAIMDAALVWPRKTPAGEPPEEVSINAGWQNGEWTQDLYRRYYWYEPLARTHYRPFKLIHCLPLSDHFLTPIDACSTHWSVVEGFPFDGFGNELPGRAKTMQDMLGEFRIAKHTGPQLYHDSGRSKRIALTTLWRGLYLTTGVSCSNGLALRSTFSPHFCPNVKWYCSPAGEGTLGWVDGKRDSELEHWLGKPVVASDCYFRRPASWQYSPAFIDRVSSSYRLWRTMFDVYATALPVCPGFDGNAADVQGHVGTVHISLGFVAGIRGMTCEVRLQPRVRSDPPEFDWHRFF